MLVVLVAALLVLGVRWFGSGDDGSAATDRAGLGLLWVDAERWNADRLAGLDARVGFGARAIDANLAGAQQLLQVPIGDVGKVGAEPAVEPHAGLGACNRDRLDGSTHVNTQRMSHMPA